MTYCPPSAAISRGFALIAVLWMIVLLTVIAGGLSYASRQSTQAVAALVGGATARYLADGATQLVIMNLLSTNPVDRLLADGETIEVTLPGGNALVTVTDENGKIDINAAREALLARLFYSLDVAQPQADALADAIVDYRDQDSLRRLNGAEDDDYLAAGLPLGAKDSDFTSVEELQRVYGMQPDIYSAMLPYVTIHSQHPGVNPDTAPLQVLMAISDDSKATIESYIEQRRDNYRNKLPLPVLSTVPQEFISGVRGITYSLVAVGVTETGQRSGLSTTIRLRRGKNQSSIETLQWRPYIDGNSAPGRQSGVLSEKNTGEFIQ